MNLCLSFERASFSANENVTRFDPFLNVFHRRYCIDLSILICSSSIPHLHTHIYILHNIIYNYIIIYIHICIMFMSVQTYLLGMFRKYPDVNALSRKDFSGSNLSKTWKSYGFEHICHVLSTHIIYSPTIEYGKKKTDSQTA